jgi:hypothetical protein
VGPVRRRKVRHAGNRSGIGGRHARRPTSATRRAVAGGTWEVRAGQRGPSAPCPIGQRLRPG